MQPVGIGPEHESSGSRILQATDGAATGTPAADPDPAEVAPGRRRNPLDRLAGWLVAGFRIASFRRVFPAILSAGTGDSLLVTGFIALLDFLISFALTGGDGTFSAAGLPSVLVPLPLALFCGLACARIGRDVNLLPAVATGLLALSIPLELIGAALDAVASLSFVGEWAGTLSGTRYYPFFGWWCMAGAVFVARSFAGFRRRMAALFAFIALVAVPLAVIPRHYIWVAHPEAEQGAVMDEETFYSQPGLLDDVLSGVRRGAPGVTDLYFLGFAGDSSQDVFMRETLAIERLFKEQFGTIGKSIALVNNEKIAYAYPFATASSLEVSLKRLGEVMNVGEDVLVLYLTSHGSEENRLEVVNEPLELREISPHDLARMLVRSGIKWKIVIVSACYSGGFIDQLKDDTTMVVTAADAENASFGCSSDADFTWFSQAYFNEGFVKTRSFTEAFRIARDNVTKRETEEGEAPSNPQMFVGKKMAEKLKELERRK